MRPMGGGGLGLSNSASAAAEDGGTAGTIAQVGGGRDGVGTRRLEADEV